MAKLVAVCRTDDYQFERRQIPLVVDDTLTMVIQFSDKCVDCNHACGIKQKDLERFMQKFDVLTKDEVAVAMMVMSRDIVNLLSQVVPCIGCRRSVERLFNQLVDSQHPALEPLIITPSAVLSVKRNYLFDARSLYSLFYIHGAKLHSVMDSIPKSKKNRRCNLHSLETHKTKSTASWIDIWDLLSKDCREEVVLVDAENLLDTLETYLRKHRFCSECKSKVLRAYSILVGDLDSAKEKGYCPSLYEGLRCCPQERHIHMLCETDFIAHLIGRAEPELAGSSRRDRHAKTLDIAQEEVLTCLGIHIYERLHRIWQKLKAEEQTWQILFYLGVDCLKKSFEMALERKQGVSNLELMCEEIEEEERVKEQRREQKRQKRKKKKTITKVDIEKENQDEEGNHCKCDIAPSPRQYSNLPCDSPPHVCGDHNSNTKLASMESCRSCDVKTSGAMKIQNGSHNSDCGYSSGPDGCDNCSVPSSNDGSDIICSDGMYSSHDGVDSVCSSITDGLDTCHGCLSSNSSPKCANSRTHQNKRDHTPSRELENGTDNNHVQSRMTLSLTEMLQTTWSSDEEDGISEEDIQLFKANSKKVLRKRQELRETLRQRFQNMQERGCSGIGQSEDLDHLTQELCNM